MVADTSMSKTRLSSPTELSGENGNVGKSATKFVFVERGCMSSRGNSPNDVIALSTMRPLSSIDRLMASFWPF